MARAVCRIVIRDNAGRAIGYGTGFRIGPGLIMTNNHVLESADIAHNSVAQFDYFGLTGAGQMPVMECALDPRAFFTTDKDLDFSIVAFRTAVEVTGGRAWFRMIRESGKALKGEAVNILQHPGGEPMQIAFRNNPVVDVLDNYLHYGADTLPGSSGSPVTNDAWDLAALHHSGVPAVKRGAILKLDNTPFRRGDDPGLIRWVANEGVRISRIVARLDGLGLNGRENELYQSSFITPDNSLIFSALGGRESSGTAAPGALFPASSDGAARWLFELRFGPVGSAAAPGPSIVPTPSAVISPPATTPSDELPSRPASPVSSSGIEEAARRLLARGERGAYFDARASANAARAYYRGLGNLRGEALLGRLRDLLATTHRPLNSYFKARIEHLYPLVDRHKDGKLRSIYSGKIMDAEAVIVDELSRIALVDPEIVRRLESGESVDESRYEAAELELERLEADTGFNCEHVVPQSWFGKADPMKSDLHHLYTCESDCNSYRGNTPYFDFADFDPVPTPDEAAVRALCGKRSGVTGGQGFEPEFGKGAAARATLYFFVRYPDDANNAPIAFGGDFLGLLIAWHVAYPVTDWERHRNEAIFGIQGNRNPFVDKPAWVRTVFGQ
jgi:endonuclease I/V8-like Glu-specific endopeptidase